jgi:hypothetical protein
MQLPKSTYFNENTNPDENFIYHIYQEMNKEDVLLAYHGDFSQTLMKAVLTLTETKMEKEGEDVSVKRKVFNIMVECLQNINKHQDALETTEYENSSIVIIGDSGKHYFISTGNIILNDNVQNLQYKLEQVNNANQDELKNLYKEIVKNGKLSDKGGAGLGLIDIARKSGEKIEYSFVKLDETYSYFSMLTKVVKKNEPINS